MSPRPESKFYARVRDGLLQLGFKFYRVENALEVSLPDVFFTCPSGHAWAEFKIAQARQRGLAAWAIDWSGRKKQLAIMRELINADVPLFLVALAGDHVAVTKGRELLDGLHKAAFIPMGDWTALARAMRP